MILDTLYRRNLKKLCFALLGIGKGDDVPVMKLRTDKRITPYATGWQASVAVP
jgi:hypothetical protein